MSQPYSRREFVVAAAGAGVAMSCAHSVNTGVQPTSSPRPNMTVLFQGDSITDADRNRTTPTANVASGLGTGYPLLLASALLEAYPAHDLKIFNRGVSGNKVPDLEERWEADTLALRPELLSILIGVNDYWHTRTHGYKGTAADYEHQYETLLASTRRALPSARLVILEPFVLRTGSVDESWVAPIAERQAIAARVAGRAEATFVPLQAAFDRAAARGGPAYWIGDGVHPTPAGHALIGKQWRAVVGW